MIINIGSKWVPRPKRDGFTDNIHWTVTKQFEAEDGEKVYRIEKAYGGRNSPAIITGKRLKEHFNEIKPDK